MNQWEPKLTGLTEQEAIAFYQKETQRLKAGLANQKLLAAYIAKIDKTGERFYLFCHPVGVEIADPLDALVGKFNTLDDALLAFPRNKRTGIDAMIYDYKATWPRIVAICHTPFDEPGEWSFGKVIPASERARLKRREASR